MVPVMMPILKKWRLVFGSEPEQRHEKIISGTWYLNADDTVLLLPVCTAATTAASRRPNLSGNKTCCAERGLRGMSRVTCQT